MNPYDPKGEKGEQVRTMFDRVAHSYDRLNHLMSLGIDRLWRRRVAKMAARANPAAILDVATGTADMAIAVARRCPNAQITGVDLSEKMLETGRAKVVLAGLSKRIRLREGVAEALPLPDGAFDAATVAFGVRNFSDIAQGLREMCRVLRPGGELFILEFSTPRVKFFGRLYHWYFHRVVPVVGGWLSGDRKAYTYLPASVDEFPAPERFLKMMQMAGIEHCCVRRLFFGVVAIYKGIK